MLPEPGLCEMNGWEWFEILCWEPAQIPGLNLDSEDENEEAILMHDIARRMSDSAGCQGAAKADASGSKDRGTGRT